MQLCCTAREKIRNKNLDSDTFVPRTSYAQTEWILRGSQGKTYYLPDELAFSCAMQFLVSFTTRCDLFVFWAHTATIRICGPIFLLMLGSKLLFSILLLIAFCNNSISLSRSFRSRRMIVDRMSTCSKETSFIASDPAYIHLP